MYLGNTSIVKLRFLSGIWIRGFLTMSEFFGPFQEVQFWSIKGVYFSHNANVLNFELLFSLYIYLSLPYSHANILFMSIFQVWNFDSRKRGLSCPKWGRGRLCDSGNARKKTLLSHWYLPLTALFVCFFSFRCTFFRIWHVFLVFYFCFSVMSCLQEPCHLLPQCGLKKQLKGQICLLVVCPLLWKA